MCITDLLPNCPSQRFCSHQITDQELAPLKEQISSRYELYILSLEMRSLLIAPSPSSSGKYAAYIKKLVGKEPPSLTQQQGALRCSNAKPKFVLDFKIRGVSLGRMSLLYTH